MDSLIERGLVLRRLQADDAARLSDYYQSLSVQTKQRFGPHPLTPDYAVQQCQSGLNTLTRDYFIVEHQANIIAYFILQSEMSVHEHARYAEQGVELLSQYDYLFAPSVADAWQGKGLASWCMPRLLDYVKQKGARSLVLMGGTQATNPQAIAFYEKYGFKRYGGYQTEVYNHDMRLILDERI